MVNKKYLMSFLLVLTLLQGSLFGMKKTEFSSDIYVPEEIWHTIYGFISDPITIKWLSLVSQKEKSFVDQNKNHTKILKKHLRNQCHKMVLRKNDRYLAANEFFNNYAQKFISQLGNSFYLDNMPKNQLIWNNETEMMENFRKIQCYKHYFKKYNTTDNGDCIHIFHARNEGGKAANFILFSFSNINNLESFLKNTKNIFEDIKNEKNIITVITGANNVRSKIFSFLPDELLQNTKIIHLVNRIDIFQNNQNLTDSQIIPDRMELCKNVKVITMRKMNIKTMPSINNFKKLHYCNLRENQITEFNNNELPKSLECLDLIDNTMDRLQIKKTESGCIVKTGKNLQIRLFDVNREELENFLDDQPNQYRTPIHKNSKQ